MSAGKVSTTSRNNSTDAASSDSSGIFVTPQEYLNGTRKRLRDYFSGEWWLNVDYVESEHAV